MLPGEFSIELFEDGIFCGIGDKLGCKGGNAWGKGGNVWGMHGNGIFGKPFLLIFLILLSCHFEITIQTEYASTQLGTKLSASYISHKIILS